MFVAKIFALLNVFKNMPAWINVPVNVSMFSGNFNKTTFNFRGL